MELGTPCGPDAPKGLKPQNIDPPPGPPKSIFFLLFGDLFYSIVSPVFPSFLDTVFRCVWESALTQRLRHAAHANTRTAQADNFAASCRKKKKKREKEESKPLRQEQRERDASAAKGPLSTQRRRSASRQRWAKSGGGRQGDRKIFWTKVPRGGFSSRCATRGAGGHSTRDCARVNAHTPECRPRSAYQQRRQNKKGPAHTPGAHPPSPAGTPAGATPRQRHCGGVINPPKSPETAHLARPWCTVAQALASGPFGQARSQAPPRRHDPLQPTP